MHEKILSRYVSQLADGSRFQALYNDQSVVPLEFVAVQIEEIQLQVEDPIVGFRDNGPPFLQSRLIGFDLRDGGWHDVTADETFVAIQHRPT